MSEPKKYLEELFKNMYLAELDRKDKIKAHLSLPVGIIIALGGVGAYYIQNFPPLRIEFWSIFFVLSCVGLFLSVVFAVYYLVRALYGYKYGYIATPGKIYQYVLNLINYYKNIGEPNIGNRIKDDLRSYLISQYSTLCDTNTQNNDVRSAYLHNFYNWIVCSLIALVISLIPSYMIQRSAPKIQKIEIINLKEGGEKDVIRTKQRAGPAERKPATASESFTPQAGTTGTKVNK